MWINPILLGSTRRHRRLTAATVELHRDALDHFPQTIVLVMTLPLVDFFVYVFLSRSCS